MNFIFFVFNPPGASSCGFLLLSTFFCSFLYGLKKRGVLFKKTGGVWGGLQRGFEGGL